MLDFLIILWRLLKHPFSLYKSRTLIKYILINRAKKFQSDITISTTKLVLTVYFYF